MTVYTDTFDHRGYSYNAAMAAFPEARNEERACLLRLLDPQPGERIVDVPAGGGFVAEALAAADADVICIEPSEPFGEPLADRFKTHIAPIWRLPIADASADKVASLAGLHHLDGRELTGFFREAFRVLRPGGVAVIADVRIGTSTADFLNGPVDIWTATGHDGRFFAVDELQGHLRSAGFIHIKERLECFSWSCPDTASLCKFAHGLFGLELLPEAQTHLLLRSSIGIYEDSQGSSMPWSLAYAIGAKPGPGNALL